MVLPERIPQPVHDPKSLCDVMIHANIALNNGRSDDAILFYTEVLYELAPAHVGALLNRSIAYVEAGYYELAVIDAHRACIAANELRKVRSPGTPAHSFHTCSKS